MLARLPFRIARSDRDTEGAEEYQHLGGDPVDGAVEDADDGDCEATRNIGHGNTSFFWAWVKRTWNNCPAAATPVTSAVPAGARRPLADAETPLSLPRPRPRFNGVFMSGSGRSASGSGSRRSFGPCVGVNRCLMQTVSFYYYTRPSRFNLKLA
jgi:hypothetical protein